MRKAIHTMKSIATILLVGFACLAAAPAQGVLINECNTGVPDWCEIVNLTPAAVDISGWSLIMADDPTVVTTFVFPANTILAPNQLAVVRESSSPAVAPGALVFTSSNINWVAAGGGACALNDAGGVGIDFIIFGNATNLPSGSPLAPWSGSIANAQDQLSRTSNTDTDGPADWLVQASGAGTPGALNPGQTPVAVTPDTGQANQALASLDINGGLNVNGQSGQVGINGPFAASGLTFDLTMSGNPNQAWFLLLGPLNRNNANFPGVGQLDIGLLGPSNFGDLQIVLNGFGAGVFDLFARTGASGSSELSFGVAHLPPGVVGTFQGGVFTGTPAVVALTAAYEFTVP